MAVYKRGNVWWYRFEFNGRRIRESSGWKSKNAALRLEAKRKPELNEGRAGIRRKAPPPRFEEAVEQFLEWSRLSQRPTAQHFQPIRQNQGGQADHPDDRRGLSDPQVPRCRSTRPVDFLLAEPARTARTTGSTNRKRAQGPRCRGQARWHPRTLPPLRPAPHLRDSRRSGGRGRADADELARTHNRPDDEPLRPPNGSAQARGRGKARSLRRGKTVSIGRGDLRVTPKTATVDGRLKAAPKVSD